MNTKLYVGNLAPSITEASVHELFSKQGRVTEVKLMLDHASGSSRGWGFVTMATPEIAQATMKALHSYSVGGRYITVLEARPEAERSAASLIGGGGPHQHQSKLK